MSERSPRTDLGILRVMPEEVFAIILARFRQDGLSEDFDVLVRHDDRLRQSNLRLAQALRLLRDTTTPGGYVERTCVTALAEAGIEEPPEENHL